MGDAASQHAERFHLLRLPQLLCEQGLCLDRALPLGYFAMELVVALGQFGGALLDAPLQFVVGLLQLAGGLVVVERELDGPVEFAVLEGREDKGEGVGRLGALQGLFVGKSGEVDDGDVEALTDPVGGFDSVDIALDLDIHQNQGGSAALDRFDSLPAGRQDIQHIIIGANLYVIFLRHDHIDELARHWPLRALEVRLARR